jgi:hypothetical protein
MPNGSMLKFFKERGGPADEDHGGALHWPGTADGFPFRGPVAPDLKQNEFEDLPLALDFHSGMFMMWDADQKAGFDNVMDRISNGWYMQHKRIDRWSDEHCGLLVWLEWVQIYGETPAGKHPGGNGHAQPTTSAPGTGPFGVVPSSGQPAG